MVIDENGATERAGRAGALRFTAFALFGAALIAGGAQVTVPMEPVPMSLQTLAVLIVGGVGGWRLGAATGAAYLLLVLAGLPVLADGASAGGADFLDLTSAGYVVGFIPGGIVAGLTGLRGRTMRERVQLMGLMLAAHAVIVAFGFAWLAHLRGFDIAFDHGVKPFLLGAIVKSALATAVRGSLRRR